MASNPQTGVGNVPRAAKIELLTLDNLACLLVLVPLLAGLLYHTYEISVASAYLETTRQLGLVFILCETAVIILALRGGYRPVDDILALSPFLRMTLLFFLATFWISSVLMVPGEPPTGPLQFAYDLTIIIHLLFAGAIAHAIGTIDRAALRRFATWMGFGALAFAVFTAIQFIARPLPEPLPERFVWQYAIPGYISVRLFGAYYGALLLFYAAFILGEEKRGEARPVQYVWMTLMAAMTIWSGTRAAILALVLILPALALGYRIWPTREVILKFVACLGGAATIAWFLIPPGDPQFWLFLLKDFGSVNQISSGRPEIWAAMGRAFLENPLFGTGPFSSGWLLAREGMFPQLQPHNAIMQFLVHWGLLGTVPVLILLFAATRTVHRIAFGNPDVVPFVAMLDALLVMSLFDGMLHFARHLMLVMVCLGVVFASGRAKLAAAD